MSETRETRTDFFIVKVVQTHYDSKCDNAVLARCWYVQGHEAFRQDQGKLIVYVKMMTTLARTLAALGFLSL